MYDFQGLMEKNNLGVGNINTPTTRYVLDYNTFYRLLTFRVKSILTCFFVFDYNIIYCNTLRIKKELFVFVLLSFFITLINLGAQIRGAQTRYTIVNLFLNQPLDFRIMENG